MNVVEAMQAMLDGKKVRYRSWAQGEYLEMNSDGTIQFVDNNQNPLFMECKQKIVGQSILNIKDDQWELHHEFLTMDELEEGTWYTNINILRSDLYYTKAYEENIICYDAKYNRYIVCIKDVTRKFVPAPEFSLVPNFKKVDND